MIEQLRTAYPHLDWVPCKDPHFPDSFTCPIGPREERLILLVYPSNWTSLEDPVSYTAKLYKLGVGTLFWGMDQHDFRLSPEAAVRELVHLLEKKVRQVQLFSSVLTTMKPTRK